MILLALAAATAHPAAAHPAPAHPAPAHPAPNSRAAALASIRTEFRETDTNHDGVLSRAEVRARIGRMKVASVSHGLTPGQVDTLADLWFARSDANHDGKITRAEAEATMAAVFDRYDANHDGVVTPAERAAAAAGVRAGPPAPGGGR